jgi:hypothetical protein
MTHLSVQNMNGVGSVMGRRISSAHNRLTLSHLADSDQQPQSGDDDMQLTPRGLDPNYAPWWIQPPLKKDEITTYRRTPAPGQLSIQQTADRPGYPMTPSNDARDLPSSYTGKPLKTLPRRDFASEYPHGWIPYEEVRVATGPEMGPTPPGWAQAPRWGSERERAMDAAFPVPYSSEDQMTYDISGFSSLHQLNGLGALSNAIHQRVRSRMAAHMSGLGEADLSTAVVDLDAPAPAAAAAAVTQQATQAAQAGASPNVVSQIIDFGAKAAVITLQATGKIPAPKPATTITSMLPGKSATPYVIGGLTLAGIIAAIAAMKSGKKGGRRR